MMNQTESILNSHFGAPVLHQVGFRKTAQAFASPVEITESYFNYTRSPLTIVKRNGLVIPLDPEPSLGFDENLVIRIEIVIRNGTIPALKKQLSVLEEADEKAMHLLRQAVENTTISPVNGGIRVTLDYPLALAELKKYGGTVYYGELDIVASLDPPETVIPHPYSERGRRENIAAASVADDKGESFGYSVFIIDNEGKYGPRYLNIGGSVYKVTPTRDFTKRDGIYVASTRPVEGDMLVTGVEVTRHAFEGAEDSVGLYRTYDEALNLGDLTTARKNSLAQLEHDNLTLQREIANMKSAQSQEAAENDRVMRDLTSQHEREKLALEEKRLKSESEAKEREAVLERQRQEMKDYYEQRSLNRKDNSEVVKVLPAIIVGIGAAIAVLMKIF
jgi:hypothetical protein